MGAPLLVDLGMSIHGGGCHARASFICRVVGVCVSERRFEAAIVLTQLYKVAASA